jgi:hypothetical protein
VVEDLDQVPERLDAGAIGRGEVAGLQQLGPDFGGSIAKAQVDGGARTKCFHYA